MCQSICLEHSEAFIYLAKHLKLAIVELAIKWQ